MMPPLPPGPAARPRPEALRRLRAGGVVPAHPLALTNQRTLDVRRQRALTRYYRDSGVTGVAVGVHSTQFAIRRPDVGLFGPVLKEAVRTLFETPPGRDMVRIAGVLGPTPQALAEARMARDLGYDFALVSLSGLTDLDDRALVAHLATVSGVLPVLLFYLQPAVGGRPLSETFWHMATDLEGVYGAKLAPFSRYETQTALRGIARSDRYRELALYTGNDDHIVADLLTPYPLPRGDRPRTKDEAPDTDDLSFVGGLLGQWGVWTRTAVRLSERIANLRADPGPRRAQEVLDLLRIGAALTEANAALFDAAHGFRGTLPGIHEALRRAGLLEGIWCLDPTETLSPGQMEAIDRVWHTYPELRDDDFVTAHREAWLEG